MKVRELLYRIKDMEADIVVCKEYENGIVEDVGTVGIARECAGGKIALCIQETRLNVNAEKLYSMIEDRWLNRDVVVGVRFADDSIHELGSVTDVDDYLEDGYAICFQEYEEIDMRIEKVKARAGGSDTGSGDEDKILGDRDKHEPFRPVKDIGKQ